MEVSMAGPEVQRIVAGEQSPLPASREGGEDFSACLAELLLRLELDASLMMAGVSQGEVSEDKNPDDLAAPEPAAFGFVPQGTEAAPGAAPAGDNGAATGAPRPPEGILIPGGLAFPGGPFQDSLKGMEPALTGEGKSTLPRRLLQLRACPRRRQPLNPLLRRWLRLFPGKVKGSRRLPGGSLNRFRLRLRKRPGRPARKRWRKAPERRLRQRWRKLPRPGPRPRLRRIPGHRFSPR